MTKLIWLLMFCPIALSSCVEVPILLTLDEEFNLDEVKMKEIERKIIDSLLKFNPGLGLDSITDAVKITDCKNGYKQWVTTKIHEGFLPADLVLSAEYMGDAAKSYCAPADLRQKYKETLKDASTVDMDINKVNFESEAKELEKLKCSNAFRDPKRKKAKITGIEMNIVENSLTQGFSPMEIYSSSQVIEDDAITKKDAKKHLVDEKLITLLASTDAIEPKVTGKKALKLNENAQEFTVAQNAIIPLTGLLLVVPGQMDATPKVIKIGNRDHFVVPKGILRAKVTINTDMAFQLSDAKCAINEFYRDIENQSQPHP